MRRATTRYTAVDCDAQTTDRHGPVPSVAAAATFDRETGRAAVFPANRAPEPAEATVDHRAFGGCAVLAARTLLADGTGTLTAFDRVGSRPRDDHRRADRRVVDGPRAGGRRRLVTGA
jgi:hypothetical protein